jgi:hypothetical protein
MEQCQEIMTLGNLPYTPAQVIANALRLLMASTIFPNREFETWDAMTVKMYPALKTFIHKAYTHRLNAMELRNTSSTSGYAQTQNMYHVLDLGDDNNSAMDITMATQVATAATGTGTLAASLLGQGTAATSGIHPGLIAAINQSIAPAFNQVVQNQSVLQSQIASLSLAHPPPAQPAYVAPPVQQVAFPMQQPFQPPMQQQQYQQEAGYRHGHQGFQGGHGAQGGRGHGRGCSQGCQRHPSVATMIRNQAGLGPYQGQQGPIGQQGIFAPPNPFGGIGPFAPLSPTQGTTNDPSLIKCFTNWNACFLCGFDVAEGHTSATCPFEWCKPNHQVGYTCENASLYAAYGPSTKDQHKTQFPAMWQGGTEEDLEHKFKYFVSALLDPTKLLFACKSIDNDDATVITSNITSSQPLRQLAGFALHNKIINIKDTHGIADTGAMSVFVKEGVLVPNKKPPLTHSQLTSLMVDKPDQPTRVMWWCQASHVR